MEQWRGRVMSDLKLAKDNGEDEMKSSLEVISIISCITKIIKCHTERCYEIPSDKKEEGR